MSCVSTLTAGIGESDCEAIRDGLLAQPVLAWTSVAYTVAAVALIPVVRSIPRSRRPLGWAYVGSLALVGVGSVAFHGPQGPGSRWLHDVPIVAVLLVIVAVDVAHLGRVSPRGAVWGWASAFVLVGSVSALAADAAAVAGGIAGAGALVGEIAVRRSPRVWVPVLAVGAVAGALNVLGRTNAPLCDAGSVIQWHGAWHVLTAVAFYVWGRAALAVQPDSEMSCAATDSARSKTSP